METKRFDLEIDKLENFGRNYLLPKLFKVFFSEARAFFGNSHCPI